MRPSPEMSDQDGTTHAARLACTSTTEDEKEGSVCRLPPLLTDGRRIAVESAIADDPARAPVEIEHRGEGKIDAAGAQFGGQQVA